MTNNISKSRIHPFIAVPPVFFSAIATYLALAGSAAEAALLALGLAVPFARLTFLLGSHQKPDLIDPYLLVPITTGLTFASGPAVLRAEGRQEQAAELAFVVASGLGAYYIGVFVARLIIGESRQDNVPAELRPEMYVNSVILRCYFALGCFSIGVYWVLAGGVPLLQSDVENSRIAALTGAGIPFHLSMALMASVWWAYHAQVFGDSTRLKMLIIAAVLLASTGWRNTPFALLAVTLLIEHYRRGIPRTRLLFGAALLICSAAGLGLYRVFASGLSSYQSYQLIADGSYARAVLVYLQSYTATFSRNLVDVLALVPQSLPYQHGESFVWNFIALLPGQERVPFDFLLKSAAGAGFQGGGLPPTLYGEWVINFGTSGLVCGLGLTGIAAAVAHHMATRGKRSSTVLCGVICAYYLWVTVRGGIGNVSLTLSWLMVLVLVVPIVSGRKSARTTDAGASKHVTRWRPSH